MNTNPNSASAQHFYISRDLEVIAEMPKTFALSVNLHGTLSLPTNTSRPVKVWEAWRNLYTLVCEDCAGINISSKSNYVITY